jgi:photosystem II stability/assembly factor-like uncharacterized protein
LWGTAILPLWITACSWGGGPASDGDAGPPDGLDAGDESGDAGCPSEPVHERYCIDPRSQDQCRHELARCEDGRWVCRRQDWYNPPPEPEFEDWAWRCRVYTCDAAFIRADPPANWQAERPYSPPDPASLTGEWRVLADSNDMVAEGCEKQPMQSATFYSLAVNPINPDVLYLGLRVFDGSAENHVSGVFKSVDGGQTWFEARAMLGAHGCDWPCEYSPEEYAPAIEHLYVDPTSPQTVYATTFDRGIYRSTDGGRYWDYLELRDYFCSNAGPVGRSPAGVLFAVCGLGLYRSEDDGLSWQYPEQAPPWSPRDVTALAFDDRFPERIWVGLDSVYLEPGSGKGVLFRSDDQGRSWTELGQEVVEQCPGYTTTVRSIAICSTDPYRMAMAVRSCGLFLSNDGGQTWHRPEGSPLDGNSVVDTLYNPAGGRCRLYASYAGRGGIWALWWSENGGLTWDLELDRPLVNLFSNPLVPEIMGGLDIDSTPSQVWIRY